MDGQDQEEQLKFLKEESKKCANLEVIDLADNNFNDDGISALLSYFPGLKAYCFANNNLSTLSDLSRRLQNTRAEGLALGGNSGLEMNELIQFAKALSSLKVRQLGLAGLGIPDTGAKHFMEELEGSNVKALDLSYNKLTRAGFEALCQIEYKGEVLYLCGNNISGDVLPIFCESLANFPYLKSLDLRGNPITKPKALREILARTTARGITLFIDSIAECDIRLMSAMHLFITKGPPLSKASHLYFPFT